MTPLTIAIILAALLAIVHFFGEEIDEAQYKHSAPIASFAAGITTAYIFLQLFPELHNGIEHLGNYAFIYALGGFAALHIAEKYIYHHEKDAEDLRYDFKELHSIFLFIYHAAIGIIITYLLQINLLQGMLFFIPILLHTAISSLALKELHEDILDNMPVKVLVSSSGLLGVILASTLSLTAQQFYATIATVTGMFLYIVVRDTIQPDSKGEPWSFLSGLILYGGIIIYLWQFIT